MKLFQKINNSGVYTAFPGVTVVSSVKKEESALWKSVYNCIANSTLIRSYFAPLPADSYHMTTINLFTQEHYNGDNWGDFIQNKLQVFKELHQFLKNNSFDPEFSIALVISAGVITLYGTLPESQKRLINTSAQKFGFSKGIPSVFHITLAYQYQDMPEGIGDKIGEEINVNLMPIFADEKIKLNPPQLCYFQDMTAFIPWDGSYDPFLQKTTSPLVHLSFIQGAGEREEKEEDSVCSLSKS